MQEERDMTDIMNATPEQIKDHKKTYWTYFAIKCIGSLCLLANVYFHSQINIVNGFSVQMSMTWFSVITLTLNTGLVLWFSKLASEAHTEVFTYLLIDHLKEVAKQRLEQDEMDEQIDL